MNLKSCRIAPFTLLIIFVNLVSISAIVLLCFEAFEPMRALLVGAVLAASALFAFRVEVVWCWGKPSWGFVLLLLLGLFLRFDPYEHFYGGQDQGLYTNFSELLTRNKGLEYTDEFRATLQPEQTLVYDLTRTPGTVALHDNTRAVAFYPLHPVWMSISRTLFGEGRNSWSNLLFSFIGVYSLYLATVLVFKSRRSGVAVAVLLTVNPALVFFTKFPVAETAALAFSTSSFLYLLASLRQASPRPRALYFVLSLLSCASFCFVKMQFLFYLPFFGILAGAFVYIGKKRMGRTVSLYSLGGIFAFGLSMVFYEHYQPYLFYGVFGDHIGTLLRELSSNPFLSVAVVVPAVALVLGGILFARKGGGNWLLQIQRKVRNWIVWLVPLGFLLSVPSIYQLIITGEMVPFGFHARPDHWTSFRFHSGYRLLLMLGPCLFLGLLFLPRFRTRSTGAYIFLVLFIFCNWLVTLTQPWVPYLYYYGRYLAVDIVPFAIVLVGGSFFSSGMGRSLFSRLCFGLTLLYFLTFSLVQIGHRETENDSASEKLLSEMGPNDIVAVSDIDVKLLTRLQLKEKINIFELGRDLNPDGPSFKVLEELVFRQTAEGHRLFLLLRNKLALQYPHFRGPVVSRYTYLSNGEHSRLGVGNGLIRPNTTGVSFGHFLLPFAGADRTESYYLYSLDSASLAGMTKQTPMDLVSFTASGFPSQLRLTGFSSPERMGAWTSENEASVRFELDDTVKYDRFILVGYAYATRNHSQVVKVTVNAVPVFEKEYKEGANRFEIEIPFDAKSSSELVIGLEFPNLTSPLEQGEGSDARRLGAMIREIRFK